MMWLHRLLCKTFAIEATGQKSNGVKTVFVLFDLPTSVVVVKDAFVDVVTTAALDEDCVMKVGAGPLHRLALHYNANSDIMRFPRFRF